MCDLRLYERVNRLGQSVHWKVAERFCVRFVSIPSGAPADRDDSDGPGTRSFKGTPEPGIPSEGIVESDEGVRTPFL